jgi:hypothetical protein
MRPEYRMGAGIGLLLAAAAPLVAAGAWGAGATRAAMVGLVLLPRAT